MIDSDKKIVILCRHAQTSWNADKRIQGRTDIDIDSAGREQARHLARCLKEETDKIGGDWNIYSGPLSRVRSTAEILQSFLRPEHSIKICDALNEVDTGIFTGSFFKDLKNDPLWHEHLANPDGYPDGESFADLCQRLNDFFDGLDAGNHIVVTHAGLIRAFVLQALTCDFSHFYRIKIDNASHTLAELGSHGTKLYYINRL